MLLSLGIVYASITLLSLNHNIGSFFITTLVRSPMLLSLGIVYTSLTLLLLNRNIGSFFITTLVRPPMLLSLGIVYTSLTLLLLNHNIGSFLSICFNFVTLDFVTYIQISFCNSIYITTNVIRLFSPIQYFLLVLNRMRMLLDSIPNI